MLAYSRSQGLFAGIDLNGGVLMPDKDANTDTYGPKVSAREVLLTHTVAAPPDATRFLSALTRTDRAQGQPAGGIK